MHENAWNIVIMQKRCNAWWFKIKNTKPIQKFHKNLINFEKTQIFKKKKKKSKKLG